MTPTLILIGGGGHCRSCLDVIETHGGYHVAGILDIRERIGQRVLDYEIIGTDEDLPELVRAGHNFVITIGQIKTPELRIKVFQWLLDLGAELPVIVSPRAYVSPHARIGSGTLVLHGAIVNAGAVVGRNCIVNTMALIEHDAVIGDHCHVATGAIVNGGVRVEDGAFIGSGAVTREYITVPSRAVVGAGKFIDSRTPAVISDLRLETRNPKPETKRTFIIAEAGVNHNGSLELARKLVDAAAAAGADAVKFQTFKAANIATRQVGKADYQRETTSRDESQFEMLEKLELDRPTHLELMTRARELGLEFLSTPFDLESVDLLAELGLETFKIPSGEITNLPYLRKVGSLKKKVILSTGMADLGEVEAALRILSSAGTPLDRITVLHCHTEYPTAFADVNLRAMATMAQAFGVKIGYSDHTPGIEAAVAAVALGATIIEKHFTLDRNLPGPDHQASLEPEELAALVRSIRNVEQALGDGVKGPTARERRTASVARKILVAAAPIVAGELFTETNITAKRAGDPGISPMLWDVVVGRKADKDYMPDEPIGIRLTDYRG